jgi:glycosyltransferase involved in cell wall biosynthesis
MWARLAGRMRHIPVIVHGRCNYGTVPIYQRPVERILGPGTKYAYAVSASTRDFMHSKRFIPFDVIEVLYNGILLDHIRLLSESERATLRRQQGAAEDDFVIGIVGRLESHKGHMDAFKAIKQITAEKKRSVQLWIVGDGAYAATLKQWVNDNNLSKIIHFTGFQKDIIKVIQLFDVQLFPSHQEGTPNTLFEAMAVGNACVASRIDGQAEILTEEKEALMFDPGHIDTMVGCIDRVMQDPSLRHALRSAAARRIKDFDGRQCIRKMEDRYSSIMASHNKAVT